MKLVIAEKPELAKDIASAILHNMQHNDGVMYDDTYTVISSFGHLFELYRPEDYDEKYKHWRLDDLPMVFDNWKRKPQHDKMKRINQIRDLMNRADCIINAGDPDDEGQLLIDEIIDYFGYDRQVYRVYVNDSVEKNIRREFSNLKDNRDCAKDGRAAYARQMGDACFGYNESRLVSIINWDKIPYGKSLSVGRVQTPTLGLIVNRDEAIANHVKQFYYELIVKFSISDIPNATVDFKLKHNKEAFGEKITDRTVLEKIANSIGNEYTFTSTEKTVKNNPPLPYNHTKLCGEMSSKYGYKLSDTNRILQVLREKHKAITYNRTDCQYLKEEHYEQAPSLLPVILKNIGKEYPIDYSIHSACFNDKNVSAHHGIIPQEREIDISQMSEQERNVYIAVCERYIMQFLPPQQCEESLSVIDLDGQSGQLVYSAKKLIDKGFAGFFGGDKKDDFSKFFLSAGEHKALLDETEIIEKETSPPKPYTDKTIIDDMASIAKYVDDPEIKKILVEKDKDKKGEHGGIGTVATRVTTIETLFKRGYIERKGKNIVSTKLGREFYHMLPDNIKSADITAKWWIIQEEIREGRADINAIQKSVAEEFVKHKNSVKTLSHDAWNILKCPFCGKPMRKWEKGYSCTGYKDGCQFTIWNEVCGKKLTAAQITAICEKGKTGTINGFVGKSEKEFSAKLILNKSTRKLEFEFVNTKKKK